MWNETRVFRVRQVVKREEIPAFAELLIKEIYPLDTAFLLGEFYLCNDSLTEDPANHKEYAIVDGITMHQVESLTVSVMTLDDLTATLTAIYDKTADLIDIDEVPNAILLPGQKIPAVAWEIRFHEGNGIDICRKYDSWSAINAALQRMVRQEKSLDMLGGSKVDAYVTFADGFVYEARLCVNKNGDDGDLPKHIIDGAKFYTGQRRPAYMTEQQYTDFIQNHVLPEWREGYLSLLNDYSFSDRIGE